MHITTKPDVLPAHALDWLSYTCQARPGGDERPRHELVEDARRLMPTRPRLGYHRAWVDNETGALYLTCGTDTMGTHVLWSGQALDAVRYRDGNADAVRELYHRAVRHGTTHPVRIDVAYDQATITPTALALADSTGTLVRHSRGAPSLVQTGPRDYTTAVGTRGTDVYVRCYDKAGEQQHLPKDAPRPYETLTPWYRLEYECRGDMARRVMERWLARDWVGIGRLCAAACAKREPAGKDTNRSRWPLAPEWAAVLKSSDAMERPVSLDPETPDIANTWAWLQRVTPRALALVAAGLGTPRMLARIARLAAAGQCRVTEGERARAVAWAEGVLAREEDEDARVHI